MSSIQSPPVSAGLSAFRNPLQGWGNDDLLYTELARCAAEAENPAVFRVLDWSELREAFRLREEASKAAKARSRALGIRAAIAAGVGAAGLALAQAVPDALERLLNGLSLALALVGAGFAAWHLKQRDGKKQWLANRAVAERLRQLYFQFVINTLPLAIRAMRDDAALVEWQMRRNAALASTVTSLERDVSYMPRALDDDTEGRETWLQPGWSRPSALEKIESGPLAEDLDVFLLCLREQRIRVQRRYAEANLNREAMLAQGALARLLPTAANVLTVAVLACSIAAGIWVFAGWEPDVWLGFSGALGALGLTLRVIEQGTQVQRDIERYEWYRPAMEAVQDRFDGGDAAAKVAALRELEAFSYQELRQFIRVHRTERFF